MSNTIRRNKFNRKTRHFVHYWDEFSEKSVNNNRYIEVWKYYSDNYYTKSHKDRKQYYKNQEYRKIRRSSKIELHGAVVQHNVDEVVLNYIKPNSIKYKIH